MRSFSLRLTIAALLTTLFICRVVGQPAQLELAGPEGARLRFVESADATWMWVGLTTPVTTEEWPIGETDGQLVVDGVEVSFGANWTLVEQSPERLMVEQTDPVAGVAMRRIFSFGPAAHVVRIETWVRSLEGRRTLQGASLLDLRIETEEFYQTGDAPASFPLFGHDLFIGLEHVSGHVRTSGQSAHLWQTPRLAIEETWQFVAAGIVGWVPAAHCSLLTADNRVRDAFLQYLDTIRIKPADLELHTNTWWSLPVPFAEADVLRHIDSLRQGFTTRTGLFFDSFALDLGWSNPQSIWQVSASRFPNEFRTIDARLRELGSRLGLWVSPGSAYPPGLDNRWLIANGYEVSPFGEPEPDFPGISCFALGNRYQREFKDNLLRLVRDYGIRHVKLDFMAHTCDVPTHGHPVGEDSAHAIDAGLADVLDGLRALNPNIVLEPLCTGYPPSPWWTAKTPYVLGPYGDDVPYGRVPSPEWMEALISARDIAYRQDQARWIMPTQAVETIDVVYQSPGQFENLAVMAIGRGRWFISTYIKPDLMTPQNWDFFAALIRWARANRQYLGNAISIGGRPEDREAYGYLFHNAGKDIYCVRNPWIETRAIDLPYCTSVSEPRELRMIYPRRETIARMQPGEAGPRIMLGPTETVVLETVPIVDESKPLAVSEPPAIIVESEAPPWVEINPVEAEADSRGAERLRFSWNSRVAIPSLPSAELCVLVEGAPEVSGAACAITVNGRPASARTVGSARQFGAAASPSPENWKWFIVPLAGGTQTFEVFVDVPLARGAIGVFLRGTVGANHEAAPEQDAVFPVWRATERPWSHTLVPLTRYEPAPPPEAEPEN